MRTLFPFFIVFALMLAPCRTDAPETSISWNSVIADGVNLMSEITDERGNKRRILAPSELKLAHKWLTPLIKEVDVPKLFDLMGNTVIALVIHLFDRWGIIEPYLKEAIYNGVLCDFTDDLEKKIKNLSYNSSKFSPDQRTIELEYASRLPISIDCKKDPKKMVFETICFCTEKRSLLYCLVAGLVIEIEQTHGIFFERDRELYQIKKKCRNEAVGELRVAGSFWYDYEFLTSRTHFYYLKQIFEGNLDGIDNYTQENTKISVAFLCSLMKPEVATTMKDVFASDALYWTLEQFRYSPDRVGGIDINWACTNDANFKTQRFGECLCSFDRGFSFCYLRVIAEYFKSLGYLMCAPGQARYNSEKKPSVFPSVVEALNLSFNLSTTSEDASSFTRQPTTIPTLAETTFEHSSASITYPNISSLYSSESSSTTSDSPNAMSPSFTPGIGLNTVAEGARAPPESHSTTTLGCHRMQFMTAPVLIVGIVLFRT